MSRLLQFVLFALLPMASVFAMSCFQASDPDLGFHLATGRAVLSLGEIPATNVLTFTQPEHPWMLHQWVPGVIFELVHERSGIAGVILTKAAIVTCLWAFVLASTRRLGTSPIAAASATLLCATAASFRFVERPLIFSHLGLAVVLYLGTRIVTSTTAGAQRWNGAALAAVMAIVCHIHAGAVYLFLLAFALGMGLVLDRWWLSDSSQSRTGLAPGAEVGGWMIIAVLIAAATLALYHPYGLRVLGTPFDMGTDAHFAAHLVEFRRPWQFPFSYLRTYWLLVPIAVIAIASAGRRQTLFAVFAVGGFLLLSFRFVRLAFAFSLVATPWIALAFDRWTRSARLTRPQLIGALLVVLLSVLGPTENWRRFPTGLDYNPHFFPRELFDVIDTLGVEGDLYTSDRWASPLIGFYWPDRRSFFDPRMDAFSREFVVDEYLHVRYGREGWTEILRRYDVEGVLLAYTSRGEAEFQDGAPNVRQHLVTSDEWALIWFDDRGELFVRTEGPNAPLAVSLGIPNFDPDRMDYLAEPRTIAAPLMTALGRGPESARLSAAAAIAVADAGNDEAARLVLDRALRRWPEDPYLRRAGEMLGLAPAVD
jgi:hypothetical protein